MNSITVSRHRLVDAPLWWHTKGLCQTASGYGRKLTTRYKLPCGRRLRRVYATCISNAASHWIVIDGVKVYLDIYEPLNRKDKPCN